MATARSLQIDLDSTPYYHCMVRCVRRHFLCGKDNYTQKDYSHRKEWIVARMKYLVQLFAIRVCAYAVMSNHYHLVLFVDEKAVQRWSNEDVVNRWAGIFPRDAKAYAHRQDKINLWRERLSSISWFMRCLNEPIARAANDEENCQGKFWEARFKSQALLDEGALLSAMVYVDLNPIRAGITQLPEQSEFTSIYERIRLIKNQLSGCSVKHQKDLDNLKQPRSLVSFANDKNEVAANVINFRLSDYLDLVEYTGKAIRGDKRGFIPSHLLPTLDRLRFDADSWLSLIKNFAQQFYHAVGSEFCLIQFSQKRKRRIKGISSSTKVYLAT